MEIDLTELKTTGWTLVDGISSDQELLELGEAIGRPVPSPSGELVKEIKRLSADEAPPGSQSSIYGAGSFPLHTDTAFWPLPVRYVLLRARGDMRRPTTVMSFTGILNECDAQFYSLAENSVWLVGPSNSKVYCSINLRQGDSVGWRYDADLMTPINDSAVEVDNVLRPLVASEKVDSINWSENTAVVLSNWKVLHGRGPEPPDEGIRIIERLYVR